MLNDSLKLNDDKSGFLIIGTPQQVTLINIGSVRVGNCTVSTVTSVETSSFDSKLSMSTHITKLSFTISAAFGVSVNISLGSRCTKTLVHAFFTAGSDYCDSLL